MRNICDDHAVLLAFCILLCCVTLRCPLRMLRPVPAAVRWEPGCHSDLQTPESVLSPMLLMEVSMDTIILEANLAKSKTMHT